MNDRALPSKPRKRGVMASLIIEIQRGDRWNKLTTVRVSNLPNDADQTRARSSAMVEAVRHLTGWRNYFAGSSLRIREVA